MKRVPLGYNGMAFGWASEIPRAQPASSSVLSVWGWQEALQARKVAMPGYCSMETHALWSGAPSDVRTPAQENDDVCSPYRDSRIYHNGPCTSAEWVGVASCTGTVCADQGQASQRAVNPVGTTWNCFYGGEDLYGCFLNLLSYDLFQPNKCRLWVYRHINQVSTSNA